MQKTDPTVRKETAQRLRIHCKSKIEVILRILRNNRLDTYFPADCVLRVHPVWQILKDKVILAVSGFLNLNAI